MKMATAAALLAIAFGSVAGSAASAQPARQKPRQPSYVSQFPYCIIYRDGLRSCGFRNLQECLQVRVGADMCVVNPYYVAPQPRSQRRHSR